MIKKKLYLLDDDSALDAQGLAVSERPPNSLFPGSGDSAAARGSFAILEEGDGNCGFELCSPGILKCHARPLKGSGNFKLLARGMTLWVDDSKPDAVVTYLYNAAASELTIECNDSFAIVANFKSGDLGIHVPRQPRVRPLISRSEAKETFGSLRRKGRVRNRGE